MMLSDDCRNGKSNREIPNPSRTIWGEHSSNMITFTEVQPTLENYWRSIILFGRNVKTAAKMNLGYE